MWEIILSGLIYALFGSISTLIGLWIMAKRSMNIGYLVKITDELLGEVGNNQEFQRKIYLLGGLLGSGVRSGIGLQKSGGKRSWQDLAIQIAGDYLLKKQPSQGVQPGQVIPDAFKS